MSDENVLTKNMLEGDLVSIFHLLDQYEQWHPDLQSCLEEARGEFCLSTLLETFLMETNTQIDYSSDWVFHAYDFQHSGGAAYEGRLNHILHFFILLRLLDGTEGSLELVGFSGEVAGKDNDVFLNRTVSDSVYVHMNGETLQRMEESGYEYKKWCGGRFSASECAWPRHNYLSNEDCTPLSMVRYYLPLLEYLRCFSVSWLDLFGLKICEDNIHSEGTYKQLARYRTGEETDLFASYLRSFLREGNKLTKEIAEQFVADEDPVDLSEFAAIEDVATESLSKYQGELDLDGLTSLSDAAAESLSKHDGNLFLDGLTDLSDPAVESLSRVGGWLTLNGLTNLSDAAAESLGKCQHELNLNGVESLSDAAAESLSKHTGPLLYLEGLMRLSDAAAEQLSKYLGALHLFPHNLPASAAKILREAGHG